MNSEIFLRSEIDRLEAEVLSLKFDVADLRSELAELKSKYENKPETWHQREVFAKEVQAMDMVSTQRK